MFRNYLKIAYRNLIRYKVYALINIVGLSVGMAACLLIVLFINYERSVDAFHTKRDRIYRLNEVQSFPGMSPQHVALSMYPMGPTMADEFPEIEHFTRFVGAGQVLEVDDQRFLMDHLFWVDPSVLTVFDFPLLRGNRATALGEPGLAVLTETTARTLFGDADPIGRSLIHGEHTLQVTGVLEDVPPTSHLQIDGLFSISTFENERMLENWGSNWLNTYLLLREGADAAALEGKFQDYQRKYMAEEALDYYQLYLQPLADIHLGSTHITHDYNNYQKFDGTYIYIFLILALFVLVIASINFMNLSTARSVKRSKEVGIRKSIGARRGQLVKQFVGESVLLSLLALVLAIGLMLACIPLLNQVTDRHLSFALFSDPVVWLLLPGVTVVVGLVSGLYPAFVLSSFQPVKVLKGKGGVSIGGKTLQRSLVVLQFALAIAMIVGTVLTLQQLNYMQTRNVGFDRSQVVVVPMNGTANENYEVFRQELLDDPRILNVTASGQRLGNNIHQTGLRAEGDGAPRQLAISHLHVDHNYLSFYGLKLAEGREFSETLATDRQRAFILNEALVSELGWEEPLRKGFAMGWDDTLGTVIGVVKDFNYNSLHHKIEPMAMSMQDWGFNEMSIRIEAGAVGAAVQHIEATWNRLVPDRPFEYTFLDDHFGRLYASDQQVARVVGLIALLAVLIACLGLFGLASISTEQRIKEIGIRKVMGASVGQLVVLLSKGFAALVGVAFLVSVPFTYVFMDRWLNNFAYHIEVGIWVFLFAGVLSLAIALLTVSYRAIATARANPVHALRYE